MHGMELKPTLLTATTRAALCSFRPEDFVMMKENVVEDLGVGAERISCGVSR